MTNSQHIDIFQGENLKKYKNITKSKKYIVFDLDETIGSFSEVYSLFLKLKTIEQEEKKEICKNDKELLFHLLDLNPEFFRYGIEIVFKYLYEKKKHNKDLHLYIYTNNCCLPITWTSWISEYLEQKWQTKNLFTNIVRAFKIKGKIIEPNRSSLSKKYEDFIKCVQIDENSQLCFIDNIEHKGMKHKNVYYLKPKPYYHYVNKNNILDRFFDSIYGIKMENQIDNFSEKIKKIYLHEKDEQYTRSEEDFEIDVLISKNILEHIQKFFYMKL